MTERVTPIKERRNPQEPSRRMDDLFCPHHETNSAAIAKHSGQWKILLWILGIGITIMCMIAGGAYTSQQNTLETVNTSVQNIDKALTAYIASHTAESRDGFRRIQAAEEGIRSLDKRMDKVESQMMRHHP